MSHARPTSLTNSIGGANVVGRLRVRRKARRRRYASDGRNTPDPAQPGTPGLIAFAGDLPFQSVRLPSGPMPGREYFVATARQNARLGLTGPCSLCSCCLTLHWRPCLLAPRSRRCPRALVHHPTLAAIGDFARAAVCMMIFVVWACGAAILRLLTQLTRSGIIVFHETLNVRVDPERLTRIAPSPGWPTAKLSVDLRDSIRCT